MSEYRLIPLHGKNGEGKFVKVDFEDYERLVAWSWSLSTGYAVRSEIIRGKRIVVRMHREITGALPEQFVDHANMERLDNRRINLRLCTREQNQANKKSQGGRSCFKGVTWSPRCGRWQASLRFEGKRLFLGRYKNEADAAKAYDMAARHYCGEFARTNFEGSEKATVAELQKSYRLLNSKKPSSRYIGVCWRKKDNRWVAQITHLKKSHYLGEFALEEQAARAFDVAAIEFRGRRTRLNFPYSDYA